MLEQIKQWVKPPVFPDNEDKTRNAQILHTLLGNILILLPLGIFGAIFFYANKVLLSVMIFTLLAGILILYVLLKRGHVLSASRLFVSGLWILSSISILLTGRFNTTLVSLQLAVTVLAGVLLGRRSAIIFTLLSVVGGLGLATLEGIGYSFIHYFPLPPLASWFTWALTFVLIITSLNPTIQSLSQSTEALRESEEKFRTLLDWTYDWDLWVSPQGDLIYCSPSCERITGWTPDDFLSNPDLKMQIVHPEHQDMFREHHQLVHDSKSGPAWIEYKIIARDGSEHWIEHACHPLFGADNRYLGRRVSNRDITERKRVEDKLLEKETQMQALNDNIPSGYTYQLDFGVHGVMHRFIYISAGVEKIFDISAQQILDDPTCLSERFLEEDNNKIAEIEASALAAMTTFKAESRFKRENGQIGWMLLTSTPRKLTNNHTVWDGVALDITEQKRVEDALQKNQVLLKETGKMAKVGGWEIDLASQTLTWTEEVYRIHEVGTDFQPTIATTIDFYTPESKPVIEQAVEAAIVHGKSFDAELPIITAKGNHRWVHAFGRVKSGKVFGAFQDITEHKQMETALIESQTKLSAIFNNSLDSILVAKAGIFIMVNPALLRLHGYKDPNELMGRSVLDLVAPESREEIAEYIRRRAIGRSTPTFYEALVLRSDGTKFWAELSISTYELDQEMYTLAIERDITERKLAEDALKHRADEFAVLYEIASEIAGENDLPELLNAITSRIATLFDVSGGGMYLYDEKRDELQVVSSTHPVVPVGTILKMGEGMAGRVAQSRQPMMVNNYSKWVYGASQYSATPFTAVVEAPMLYRGKLIGVLAASEIGDEAHQFTEEDLRLLSLLANGVAGVIQNARDLTERKQVEEKLSESEERFRTFIEQSADGFMLANEQGTIIAWNQALSQITGLPREQALGMTMWDLQYQMVAPEKRARLSLDQLRNALQTMQSGESPFFRQAYDAEIQTVHGERKFIQQTSFPIHTAQGTRIGAVVRDVTEHKQMEIALLENEEKYRDLFEHVPVALWDEDFSNLKTHLDKLRESGVTDLRAHLEQHPQDVVHCAELIKVIDVNQATLNLFETETKEQLLGNLKRIFRYQSPTIIKEEIITLYGGEAPYQGEMITMSLNGNSFHCHIEVAIPPGYEETWEKVFVSVTDITERKQMEEREHEQRALAEALSNSAAALNSTLDFNDVLDHIIDNVGRVVPHDAANIMLLDVDNDKLSLVCHRGYIERGAKNSDIEQQFSLATSPILREVARTGQPLAIPETRAYPDWTSIPATEWVNSYLTVPIQVRRTTVGFLNLDSETIDFFTPDHAERLQAFANHAAIAINNAQLYEDMKVMAVTDALTGIYNRAFFETELARIELSRDFPVSIIVADLDNLKTTNDTLGHTAGDNLIRNTAKILQKAFRAADIIARIGGDEFSVLLPKTDAETAEQMLSRVRAKITEHNAAPDIPVQLSLGAATAEQGKLMDALTIADQRMYADKAMRKSSK